MVRKVHKYANGGQVKDHSTDFDPSELTYWGAVKDRVKSLVSGGAAGKAAKTLKASKSMRDKQIEEQGG